MAEGNSLFRRVLARGLRILPRFRQGLSPAERTLLIGHFRERPTMRLVLTAGDGHVAVTGYAANLAKRVTNPVLLLNGQPLPGSMAPATPGATGLPVFRWWPDVPLWSIGARIPLDQFAQTDSVTLTVGEPGGEPPQISGAWTFPASLTRPGAGPVPPPHLITRVMGYPNPTDWRIGGAVNLHVIEQALAAAGAPDLTAIGPVLEWASGSGRLTQHLIARGLDVTGIDIDGEAVGWCQSAWPGAGFIQVPLSPPTPLPSAHFGLMIGISVLTHLTRAQEAAWLQDMARVIRPGGYAAVTISGLTALQNYDDAVLLRDLLATGISDRTRGHLLDPVLGAANSYYRETLHTQKWIAAMWPASFELVAIHDGAHLGQQDLVILRRRP